MVVSMNNDDTLRIVLDIDEVLVHTYLVTVQSRTTKIKQLIVKKKVPKKTTIQELGCTAYYREGNNIWTVKFVKRPGLDIFLSELCKLDVCVVFWTAAQKKYADAVLNSILPEDLIKCQRLYRRDCLATLRRSGQSSHSVENGHLNFQNVHKDLSKIFNDAQLKRAVLFDDTRQNLEHTRDNGVLCPRWMGCMDNELVEPSFLELVIEAIEFMLQLEDVRTAVRDLEKGLWLNIKEDAERKEQEMQMKRESSGFSQFLKFVGVGTGFRSNTSVKGI